MSPSDAEFYQYSEWIIPVDLSFHWKGELVGAGRHARPRQTRLF